MGRQATAGRVERQGTVRSVSFNTGKNEEVIGRIYGNLFMKGNFPIYGYKEYTGVVKYATYSSSGGF
jgi:hypothetical protein